MAPDRERLKLLELFVNDRGVGWSPAGTFRSRGGSLKRARPHTGAPSSQERAPRMGHSSEFASWGTQGCHLLWSSSFVRVQLVFEAIASLVIIVLNSIMICKPVSLREQFATQAMAELGMCKYVFLTSGGKAIGGHRSSREMASPLAEVIGHWGSFSSEHLESASLVE